ncbi:MULTISPECIES: branched-chain amino acid aminotransferase [Christiangramia]|uniref:Branched-chain-amino-acid aminotransferase n=2 Tax=Christiangramia TaxID=292691 RepID=A0A1L7I627_9FLAO|nr:branched-chain amino acid aminotransferase [Christiangramia flava]APU69051.1 Branched-chain amino acid aminotransferase [Christiangramia flava JLT2011]OSS38348.1 Branched-chain amino acid aminotransferase [Christiangramia flava JLT2011]
MKNLTSMLDIQKADTSKIDQVDFNNLVFGQVFTDHMFECDYKNGSWQTPVIKPYGNLSMPPSARVFHYGQAVFEGMKAYKDQDDQIWLFRPEENFNRINKSSERLAIPEFPKEYFFEGLETLLKMDSAWIQKGFGNSLYIRPFVMATEAGVSASPAGEYKFMIICSPAQAYYSGEVRVKFSEKFSRAADGGVGYAKAAGNYGAQFYPTNLAKEEGFQQIVWTDASTHEYLEEAGTMNVFFRIGDKLVTAPTSDRILDGVTRKSVITLAEDHHIDVEVRRVSVQEILDAAKSGELKEMFGSGTATVINPILGFGFKGEKYELPKIEDSYAKFFKDTLMKIQYNEAEDKFGWRHQVK